MKHKEKIAHMRAAFIYSQLSYCQRKQIGCIFVKNDRIISIGYNGTPPGWENCCEDEDGNTKPEVHHAELNAIAKLARSTESGEGASVFLTCSPCYDCAVLMSAVRVKEVFYAEDYAAARSAKAGSSGIEHLQRCNIPVSHFPFEFDNN